MVPEENENGMLKSEFSGVKLLAVSWIVPVNGLTLFNRLQSSLSI